MASSAAGQIIWGKAVQRVDNTGGADDAKSIVVELSCGTKDFLYDIASASIQADDVGKTAYATSDRAVNLTATDQSVAGTVMGVSTSPAGVWLRFAQ